MEDVDAKKNGTENDAQPPAERQTKKRRGFAAMDPAKVREIASRGGKAAHALGVAHEFSSEEASVAGRKGGQAPHKTRGRRSPAT